jgi:thioredoxin-like negative regulator of GroEL
VVREVPGSKWRASDLPKGRALVLFTADWCGHCRRFEPLFKKLRDQWMVDISDEEDPLWDALGIHIVPTVILFEDGVPTRRWAGALGASHMDDIRAVFEG